VLSAAALSPGTAGIRIVNIFLTIAVLNGMVNVANNKKEVFTPAWQSAYRLPSCASRP
jgi:hypothetical protein